MKSLSDLPIEILEKVHAVLNDVYPPATVGAPSDVSSPESTHKLVFAAGKRQVVVDILAHINSKKNRGSNGSVLDA